MSLGSEHFFSIRDNKYIEGCVDLRLLLPVVQIFT